MTNIDELCSLRAERDAAMRTYSDCVAIRDMHAAGKALKVAAELTALLDECLATLRPVLV